MWDARQYEAFRDERARPFHDLVARVTGDPRTIADLGCGTGRLTCTLLERWPEARIAGIDSSAEMLAAVRSVPGRLEFAHGDAASWRPTAPLDLVVSNAMLQWLPDHAAVLAHMASLLAPGGTLAVQMPGNFAEPSHTLLREVVASGPWAAALQGTLRDEPVHALDWYVETLRRDGFEVDAWETTYLHQLEGDDAVLGWVKGTALRPVLARLDGEVRAGFLTAYGTALGRAYPRRDGVTFFPFRRLFFVARRTR